VAAARTDEVTLTLAKKLISTWQSFYTVKVRAMASNAKPLVFTLDLLDVLLL